MVEVGISGPQGVKGDPGVTMFSGSTPSYTQEITTPSADWVITHNLGYIPNITVQVGGVVVLAEIYSTSVSATIHFNTPQVGLVVAS